MRSDPRSTRLIVAVLYGRLRTANRLSAQSRLQNGIGSVAALQAGAAAIEAHNALCVVTDTLNRETQGGITRIGAHTLVNLTASAARVRRRNAA